MDFNITFSISEILTPFIPADSSSPIQEDLSLLCQKIISDYDHVSPYLYYLYTQIGTPYSTKNLQPLLSEYLGTTPLFPVESDSLLTATEYYYHSVYNFIHFLVTLQTTEDRISPALLYSKLESLSIHLKETKQDYLYELYTYLPKARRKINHPKTLVALAKKYASSVLSLPSESAISIFKHGTCVILRDDEKETNESWEDFAIRILNSTREDFYPEEYGPDYINEDETNEYGEKPFWSNSKGYLNLFFWGEESFFKDCSLLHEIVDEDLANPEVVHIIFNENKY